MIISSLTGGRLANQLYFVLLAYRISKLLNMPCKYTQILAYAKLTLLDKYAEKLNISDYFIANEKPNALLKLNQYYQNINIDFSTNEIAEFIQQTILKSDYFNSLQDFDLNTVTAIHIRNGDYLNLPYHNCFNRYEYIKKALALLPTSITTIDVYSDDNSINKNLYDSIFQSHFTVVNYINNNDPLEDFKALSFYKTKILWNSTFSYWTAFIADERYKNETLTICPIKFSADTLANTHCKNSWKLI